MFPPSPPPPFPSPSFLSLSSSSCWPSARFFLPIVPGSSSFHVLYRPSGPGISESASVAPPPPPRPPSATASRSFSGVAQFLPLRSFDQSFLSPASHYDPFQVLFFIFSGQLLVPSFCLGPQPLFSFPLTLCKVGYYRHRLVSSVPQVPGAFQDVSFALLSVESDHHWPRVLPSLSHPPAESDLVPSDSGTHHMKDVLAFIAVCLHSVLRLPGIWFLDSM